METLHGSNISTLQCNIKTDGRLKMTCGHVTTTLQTVIQQTYTIKTEEKILKTL